MPMKRKTKLVREYNLNVRIDKDLLTALEKYAASVNERVSTVVRMTLHEDMKKRGFLT